MNTYPAKNIINVAMAGHSGAGKTSLAEAMLYLAGASDRRGKVGEGNTVCDSDPEEIRRKTSVSTAVAPFEWKNKKINLLDTPPARSGVPCKRGCRPSCSSIFPAPASRSPCRSAVSAANVSWSF